MGDMDTVMVTDTDTTVMVTDTDTTVMVTITANDPPNLPLKPMPHPHLTTDTDTTDTTDMDTVTVTATTMANNKATTPLNNATFIWLKKKQKLKFLNLAVPISLPHQTL